MSQDSKKAEPVLNVEFDREQDGRWIAEIPELPGVLAYGRTKEEALIKVQALAYRVIADRIEEEGVTRDSVRFAFA
jgi:predicted RNase H-like HicB family nuclease